MLNLSFRLMKTGSEVTFANEGSKLLLEYGPKAALETTDYREYTSHVLAQSTLLSYVDDHIADGWEIQGVKAVKAE